jgi:hypothetical protein
MFFITNALSAIVTKSLTPYDDPLLDHMPFVLNSLTFNEIDVIIVIRTDLFS